MPSTIRYAWDERTLRFRDQLSGRYVQHRKIFTQFNRVVIVSDRRINRLVEQYRGREITLSAFKSGMREEIKSLHIAQALITNGGLDRMTPKLWGEVGAHLRKEYAHLNDFITQVARGKIKRESGRLKQRARSYTANAREQFWKTTTRRFLEREDLIVTARRHLGPVGTEHCRGCDALKGKWFPLAELPPIGSQPCLWFCKCYIEFRIRRRKQ